MSDLIIRKTGTTTVGVVCKDGVILAADKKMTLGGAIISSLKAEKVIIINNDLAVTTAGVVSDIQLLVKIMRAQIKLEELKRNKSLKTKESANLLANLVYNNIRKMSIIQGVTGFLLAGRDKHGTYLYELGMDGALNKYDNFACDGSGMMFAMGVLEDQYTENMPIEEAIELAVKSVRTATKRDTASGGGIDVVTITKEGTKRLKTRQIKEVFE